jgi:hypothetical protein
VSKNLDILHNANLPALVKVGVISIAEARESVGSVSELQKLYAPFMAQVPGGKAGDLQLFPAPNGPGPLLALLDAKILSPEEVRQALGLEPATA